MTAINDLTPGQLNERIATVVMGWHKTWDGWRDSFGMMVCFMAIFNPAESHTDCYRAEARMREMGLIEQYINNLVKLISGNLAWIEDSCLQTIDIDSLDGWHIVYEITHAPCDQRCKAMLMTMEERDEKNKDG